jgi:hypothetical protein
MEITTLEWNGVGLRQTRERGIALGLTRLHCCRSKRARLLVGSYVVPALCAIAIGLGGCSAAATAPSGQDAEANAPDAQCPAGPQHCKVEAALVKGDPALMDETASLNRERAPQPASPGEQPGSCLTDYFFSTKRPWCTALDWFVVLPVALFIVGSPGAAAP